MNRDPADHRPRSTPLFHAIPTGTYTYRYRDAETGNRIRAEDQDMITESLKLESESSQTHAALEPKLQSESAISAASPTSPSGEGGELVRENDAPPFNPPSEATDAILYRETVAVLNGSMTLLSKQVGVEAPQTGARGRAREREARRFAAARIMPSQGLVDAAKALSRRGGSGTTVSYPPLTAEGYLVDQKMEEREGREARVRKPNEMLLAGCGPDYDRRSRERGRSPTSTFQPTNIENRFMVDGEWESGTEPHQVLAPHPDGESWRRNPYREKRERERSRLLTENALLKRQIARLEEAAARRREKEALRAENERLRTELKKLNTEADGGGVDEEPAIARTFSGDLAENEDLWKDAGLGNQPRRSANRGNRVGASLMSQEVMIEHPSAGKGRAREREEKRRLRDLAREPSRSDSDSDNDENRRRRRTNWRTRGVTASAVDQDTNGNNEGDIDTGSDDEHRGRKSFRDAARRVPLTRLPPDVLAKDGPDRPPRIWRERSHEISEKAANGGGSKGRRREVKLKNEEEMGERVRFRPPIGLVATAKGVNGVDEMRDEDDEKVGMCRCECEELAERVRGTQTRESRDAYLDNQQETIQGRSPDEALAKYATDRPPRMFRDGSCEVLAEGEVAGRRRRREAALRQQLPEPRFMPSREMAKAAAKVDRGENAFLSDEEKDKDSGGA